MPRLRKRSKRKRWTLKRSELSCSKNQKSHLGVDKKDLNFNEVKIIKF